jgi:hypothetical protein
MAVPLAQLIELAGLGFTKMGLLRTEDACIVPTANLGHDLYLTLIGLMLHSVLT